MTETLIWIGVALAVAAVVWMAEPHHTRLVQKAHERLAAEARDAN